jgi:hypothetical protein
LEVSLESRFEEGLTNGAGRDRPFIPGPRLFPQRLRNLAQGTKNGSNIKRQRDRPETKCRGNFALLTGPELGLSSQINKDIAHV